MEEAEKMPVVILSLHQKWWQKMAAGEKVLELRKTKPQCKAPFRVLVYVTGGAGVLGEFICPARDYVLVEKFLRGTEIGVDGFVQNHKLVFLAPHTKFVYRGAHTTVPRITRPERMCRSGAGFPLPCNPPGISVSGAAKGNVCTAFGIPFVS